MLYGAAVQFARHDGGSKGVTARQIILVPAAKVAFVREISEKHPRKPWGSMPYTLDLSEAALGAQIDDLLGMSWSDYKGSLSDVGTGWYLTHDIPVLFHIADDEAADMVKGKQMPRNIPLRFQRALDAVGSAVLGADAKPLADVLRDREYESLEYSPSDTLGARVKDTLTALGARIDENRTETLDRYTPPAAQARGAGEHLNGEKFAEWFADLPEEEEPEEAEAAPVAEPAGTVAADKRVRPGTTLTRPNGLPYVAREVNVGVRGMSDVDLMRDAMTRREHILLGGEPGTGKTALLEVAAPSLITYVASADTEASDLMGSYVVTLGEDGRESLLWQDGPVTRAAIEGRPILIDEISMIAPNQLTALYGLMDGRLTFTLPQNPARGTLHVKEGFVVLAAYNPNAPGSRMSEALASRFGLVAGFTSDYKVMRGLGVNERMVAAAEHMEKQRQNDEISWAPQSRDLLRFMADEKALGLLYALQNLLSNVPEVEVPVVKANLMERFGDVLRGPDAKKVGPLQI